MTQLAPDPSALERSLGQLRIAVLVALAACAVVILSHAGVDEEPVDHTSTMIALGLALGSTILRRLGAAGGVPARLAVAFTIVGMLLALAVGALGVFVTQTQAARETGMLFALGAFILALPRPSLASLSTAPKN